MLAVHTGLTGGRTAVSGNIFEKGLEVFHSRIPLIQEARLHSGEATSKMTGSRVEGFLDLQNPGRVKHCSVVLTVCCELWLGDQTGKSDTQVTLLGQGKGREQSVF